MTERKPIPTPTRGGDYVIDERGRSVQVGESTKPAIAKSARKAAETKKAADAAKPARQADKA